MGKLSGKLKSVFGRGSSRLTFMEKLTLALPGPASVVGEIVIHNALMKFYTDIIGIDPRYIGWIYVIYNIWNAINDPLLGVWVDRLRYNERRGKYVYLMKVTAPVMLVSIFGMLLSSPSWNDWVVFGVLLAELFIYDTAYTIFSVAYQSYFLVAAPSKEERVDIDIIRTYIGNAIGAVTTIIPTLLLVGDGNRALIIPVFSAVILVNALMYVLALRTLKERGEMYKNTAADGGTSSEGHAGGFKEVWKASWVILKSKPFLTYLLFYITARGAISYYYTPFLYFMDSVLCSTGLVATIADTIPGIIMLIALPFAGKLIKKYGSKTITLWAYVPGALGFASLLVIREAWQACISYTLIVLSLNIVQTAGVVINGALIDRDEMLTGVRKTGLYGGLFSLLATSLTSFQAVIFTNIIGRYGYDGNAVTQTAEAVWGIRLGAGLVPLVMGAVGLIPMLLFPIGRDEERRISEFSAGQHAAEERSADCVGGEKERI